MRSCVQRAASAVVRAVMMAPESSGCSEDDGAGREGEGAEKWTERDERSCMAFILSALEFESESVREKNSRGAKAASKCHRNTRAI